MTRWIFTLGMVMVIVFTLCDAPFAGSKEETGKERCVMKPRGGPCKALFHKYYFDEKSGQCRSFVWGGCQGVVPFETLEECRKTCIEADELKITEIAVNKNRVYGQISLEYPGSWKDPVFSVKVDGQPVRTRAGWGGSSGERRMKGLLFYPGRAGEKKITVSAVIDGKQIEAQGNLSWKPEVNILLMGLSGDHQLVTKKEQIRIAVINLERPNVYFNGKGVTLKMDLRGDIKTFSFEPEWTKGRNKLIVKGADSAGKPLGRDYSFVYSADGTIEEGESFTVDYGYMGSKSGPFFSVTVEGNTLEMAGHRDSTVYEIDGDGWIQTGEMRYLKEFRTVRPGSAKVLIYKKSHFLQPKELEKEMIFTVVPRNR